MSAFVADAPPVGNDAGWAFRAGGTTIGRNDYYADVTATLPSGLGGGEYELAVERLPDDVHAAFAEDAAPDSGGTAELYLFWRDTLPFLGALGGGAGELVAGLITPELKGSRVAELKITGVSRRLGARVYESRIEAREAAFHALSRPMTKALKAGDLAGAASEIGRRAGVTVRAYPIAPAPAAAGEIALPAGLSYADALGRLASWAELVTGQFGRGMVLLRDGTVHFGPRAIPLEGRPKPLQPAADLLEVEALAPLATDPWPAPGTKGAPARDRYQLVLKGRPDIKPGDVVTCPLPSKSAGLAAGAGLLPRLGDIAALFAEEPSSLLHVDSVRHRLGRTTGFMTTLTAVVLGDLAQPWDSRAAAPAEVHRVADTGVGAQASAALDAATAVRRAVSTAVGRQETIDVAEVRAVQAEASEKADAQTLTLWRGLAAPDGLPNAARRLAIERSRSAPLAGVGYLTPFAWGACGLVLPRYPGARVAIGHRNGDPADPVDLGCIWEAGKAPAAHTGDWWLVLPVGVSQQDRAAASGTGAPPAHKGAAVNDLTDADGNRVIELGELTVRVGRRALKDAGERPARTQTADAIEIEHADGNARIVIDKNGGIEITAKGALALKSTDGDITLDAKNVKVKVAASGVMDVR